MIVRLWHGRTTIENALPYEELLKSEIFPLIKEKNVRGFISIELLKKKSDTECEFITIMKFESIEAVKEFAGENYENAFVLPKAQTLLKNYDKKAQHYYLIR